MGNLEETLPSSLVSPTSPVNPAPPHLFLVIAAHRPMLAPARHSLADLDVVHIGRSPDERYSERLQSGRRTLVLGVPDRWMSSGRSRLPTHARLVKVLDGWTLQDEGSRNGTFHNGVRVERAVLHDGDLLELGHSFFLYRESLAVAPDDPLDALAPPRERQVPGTATLLPALAQQLAALATVSSSAMTVMLMGQTGTGKELAARAVHALSGRKGPMIAVNCGALPEPLIESELFGFRKGAFSGAVEDRLGLIRSADQGTLFLDEIGDLPLGAQAALLRVLQEHQVVPVGGTRPVPVDFRLCAATHLDLEQRVEQGRFRADLLARLGGFTLQLPPLHERREDLGLLVRDLLCQLFPERAEHITFSRDAIRTMLLHTWPHNIRELAKCLEHAAVLAGSSSIGPEHLPPLARPAPQNAPWPGSPSLEIPPEPAAPSTSHGEQARRAALADLLAAHRGNISVIARQLGKDRSQIRRWLHRYHLDPEQFRAE